MYRFRKSLIGAESSPYLPIAKVHYHPDKVAKEEPPKVDFHEPNKDSEPKISQETEEDTCLKEKLEAKLDGHL